MKKFLAVLLVVFSFGAAAQAAEVTPYFAWMIKNYDDYSRSTLNLYGIDIDNFNAMKDERAKSKFFFHDINIGDINATRDKLYDMINCGQYSGAATLCEMITVYQKIIFGVNYFDASLTELTAKIYLAADELDKAERKINLLTANAVVAPAKVRALNLKSELLNRRGNFAEALQLTQEAAELLKSTPDEKLSLTNRARAARAYYGLGDMEKSLAMTDELLPLMTKNFGATDPETLALMSTAADACRNAQRQNDALKILLDKFKIVRDHYDAANLVALSKAITELAKHFFETGTPSRGEEFLSSVMTFAEKYVDEEDNREALQLYTAVNKLAKKHLPADNPIALKATLGLARLTKKIGDIDQSIELCQNLPHFKKFFGESADETLTLTKILGDDYLSLGLYAKAKTVTDERLRICKKNFGTRDERTIAAAIDLADICYRTGQYKTADKLLVEIDVDQAKSNPKILYNFLFTNYFGVRMKGGNIVEHGDFLTAATEWEEKGLLNLEDSIRLELEMMVLISNIGGVGDISQNEMALLNIAKLLLSDHHPKILETMNAVAEANIAYGYTNDAARFAQEIIDLSRAHFGKDNFYEWMALNTLAKVRRAEGKFSDALNLDNKALLIAERVCGKNSPERLKSLDAIASDQAADRNFTEAIKIREGALREARHFLQDTDALTVQLMTNLATDYSAAGRYSDAVKLCDETLALLKVPVYIGEQISEYATVTELIRIKATAQKFSGDDAAAHVNFKKLIQVYEGKRAAAVKVASSPENMLRWFAGVVPAYKDAASVAAAIGDADFAFYCSELCKGRNLIDRFNDILVAKNYLITPQDKILLNEYEKLLSSSQAVVDHAAYTRDENLRFDAEIVRMNLQAANAVLKTNLRQKYSTNALAKDVDAQKTANVWRWDTILKNFDVEKNQRGIPNGACFIEFMKTADDSLLVTFLHNEGDIQTINISVDKNFFDSCRLFHEMNAHASTDTQNNDDTEFYKLRQEISNELSATLMPALEKFAGNSSHWIISPDAELNLVPFETLVYREKFLVESKDVSYVPSLAVMNLMRNRERKNSYLGRSKELFAMGDAVYENADSTFYDDRPDIFNQLRGKLNDLPGTARELDKVSSLFDSKEIFRREQATEKNLRELNASGELANYKYLLFAAHGIFFPESPELSSIILSQQLTDADNDGYVTVGEWMSYDLRSNLIYLSACESGRGSYQAGEGIVGIPYALTVAGNKDTVMSLWKVNDEATAEFTSSVFEKLRRGQSEVQALNETKREFLKQNNHSYRDPSIWAAFLLYGI